MDVKQERNPLEGLQRSRSMVGSAQQAMVPLAQPRQPTLQPLPDGSIRLGRFRLTKVGLVAEGYVTETDWKAVYAHVSQIHDSLAWVIGDWCNMGERTWGKSFDQLVELTGLKKETLWDYAWVSRSVETSIRIEVLSFSHHRLVAAHAPETQAAWLTWAATAGKDKRPLSLAAFRLALAEKGLIEVQPRLGLIEAFQAKVERLYGRGLKKVEPGQRLQMAELLRQMADRIEKGE